MRKKKLNRHNGRTTIAHQAVGLGHGNFGIFHLAFAATAAQLVGALDDLPECLGGKGFTVRREPATWVDGQPATEFGLAVANHLVGAAFFTELAGFQVNQVMPGAVVRQFQDVDILRTDTGFFVGLL